MVFCHYVLGQAKEADIKSIYRCLEGTNNVRGNAWNTFSQRKITFLLDQFPSLFKFAAEDIPRIREKMQSSWNDLSKEEKKRSEMRHWATRGKLRPFIIRGVCIHLNLVKFEATYGCKHPYRQRIIDKEGLIAFTTALSDIHTNIDLVSFNDHVFASLKDNKGASRFYEINRTGSDIPVSKLFNCH